MKRRIVLKILSKLKSDPRLRRKVKIAAAVAVVGLLLTTVLIVWAGLTALNFVAGTAGGLLESPQSAVAVETLRKQANELTAVPSLNCWNQAQSLLALEPWLARPALENLNGLKVACLNDTSGKCNGPECSQKQNLRDTQEETTI